MPSFLHDAAHARRRISEWSAQHARDKTMSDLNQYEIEVLEMMDGRRKGQWGAWVRECLGELAARGYCTRGPNYQITPKGRAFLDVRKDMQGATDA